MNNIASHCKHKDVSLINPWELIRKYRCNDCGLIMMCSCQRYVGETFLSHQIHETAGRSDKSRLRVDGGFVDCICRDCRGLEPVSFPIAELYGATSKIKRYYWHEIAIDTIREFGEFCLSKSRTDWLMAQGEYSDEYAKIENNNVIKYKKLHSESPKYVYAELSQEDVFRKYSVERIEIKAKYVMSSGKALVVFDGGRVPVETLVMETYKEQGYSSIKLESTPLHALFAVLMGVVLSDPRDDRLQYLGFGDRDAFERGERGPNAMIWCFMPEDFGGHEYWLRRELDIRGYISSLPDTRGDLQDCFDVLANVPSSHHFRQYLWAHKEVDIDRARKIVDVIPVQKIKEILIHLSKDYWGHYLGWPDLLIYNDDTFFLAEVKSSKDKLSEDQKGWIARNYEELHLPFKLIKVTKQIP